VTKRYRLEPEVKLSRACWAAALAGLAAWIALGAWLLEHHW
jgi:hypothetical protein